MAHRFMNWHATRRGCRAGTARVAHFLVDRRKEVGKERKPRRADVSAGLDIVDLALSIIKVRTFFNCHVFIHSKF